MPNTTACAASSHPLDVINTAASTTVVMAAPKRGPRGSTYILRNSWERRGRWQRLRQEDRHRQVATRHRSTARRLHSLVSTQEPYEKFVATATEVSLLRITCNNSRKVRDPGAWGGTSGASHRPAWHGIQWFLRPGLWQN